MRTQKLEQIGTLDVILGQLNWTKWESRYHGRLGQPPIHPRVLAGVLLYGLLTRIRSSRCLEDALHVRLDFRWLAEGRTIDHTTLSEFRRKCGAELKDLFVQVGLIVSADVIAMTNEDKYLVAAIEDVQEQFGQETPSPEVLAGGMMATLDAKQKYARRRHPGERPFAVIKHLFGARRSLLRGLDCVRTEWNWLATAFNLQRLTNLIQGRAGPTAPDAVVP